MRILILSFLVLVNSLQGFAQDKIKGNRNVTIVETQLDDFNAINISEDFEVLLMKGSYPAVEIETDENLHDVINASVDDGVFSISTITKIRSKKRLKVTLKYASDLKLVELKDDAELETVSTINTDSLNVIISDHAKANLDVSTKLFTLKLNNRSRLKLNSKSNINILSNKTVLELSESSKLDAFVKADSLQLTMLGNTTLTLKGNSDNLKSNLSGSADVLGKEFSAKQCFVSLKEDADITLQATDEITINSSGIGETYLYGNPKIIIENFAGKSKLHKKEL